MVGIYSIKNTVNNKIYVGLSMRIEKRLLFHKRRLKNGTHENIHLQRSFSKYGKEAFKFIILEECVESGLHAKEICWIKKLGSQNDIFGYNITKGGEGRSAPVSQDVKNKIRKALLGVKHTQQRKNNVSDSLKGRTIPMEARGNISKGLQNSKKYKLSRENLRGRKHSKEHKRKISKALEGAKNPFYGKKHKAESKQKMREKKFIVIAPKIIADIVGMRNSGSFYRQIKEKYNFSVTKIISILKEEQML